MSQKRTIDDVDEEIDDSNNGLLSPQNKKVCLQARSSQYSKKRPKSTKWDRYNRDSDDQDDDDDDEEEDEDDDSPMDGGEDDDEEPIDITRSDPSEETLVRAPKPSLNSFYTHDCSSQVYTNPIINESDNLFYPNSVQINSVLTRSNLNNRNGRSRDNGYNHSDNENDELFSDASEDDDEPIDIIRSAPLEETLVRAPKPRQNSFYLHNSRPQIIPRRRSTLSNRRNGRPGGFNFPYNLPVFENFTGSQQLEEEFTIENPTTQVSKRKPIVYDEEAELEEQDIVVSDDEWTDNSSSNTSSLNTSTISPQGAISLSLSEIISLGKLPSRRCPPELRQDPQIFKFWKRRYQLFSKYDEGIKLDNESWYSVTPEKIAAHIAHRCSRIPDAVILDAFCGCGGNAIQFARKTKVIAIDIDPAKIEFARHNARIYGVEHNIDFRVGDCMELIPTIEADVVFLSPPWGGPEYLNSMIFDIRTMMPLDGFKVFELAKSITSNIAYFVPRTTDKEQLQELAGPGGKVEIEDNILDNRVVTITAYYGDLVTKAY